MKNIKKLLSIVMVLTLVLSLGASALAADVTIEQPTGEGAVTHTYTAYQIFSGTQNDESGNKLASVEWGKDIDGAGFLTALKAEPTPIVGLDFSKCETAADVSAVISDLNESDNADLLRAFGKLALSHMKEGSNSGTGETKIAGLATGYYVFADTTPNDDLGADVRNDIVLQVTENMTVKFKNERPSSEKKVKDVNDSDPSDPTNGVWADSADHDVDDTVEYRLKASVHDLSRYGTYYLQFVDNISAGLTYDGNAKVYYGNPDDETEDVDATEYFDLSYQFNLPDGASKLTWTCDNIKNFTAGADDATIYILYTCTLNSDAVIGPDGNPNDMHIEFSRDPNSDQKGETPDDTVIVFTYEFDANKVEPDGDGTKALEGAGFTLLKKVAAGGSTETFHKGTSNEVSYDDVVVVGSYEVKEDQTTFEFKGLDDGDYILVESTVPDGYNKAADIEFTISATHSEEAVDPELLTFEATGDVTVKEAKSPAEGESTALTGKITTDVVNRTGLELPETGGIGTTFFYVVGAILVAGAVILLVTRKRMNGADK